MSITKHGNPDRIKKVCEWTGKPFVVDWKHRNQRFVNKLAMYQWRKSQNRETVPCVCCGKLFERYRRILHPRSGKLREHCSNACVKKSPAHREAARHLFLTNNPMEKEACRNKISQTKLKNHGDPRYNNQEKSQTTCLERYGVACYLDSPLAIRANGKRVSKFQQLTYEKILVEHPDAELEKYLEDTKCSVDIHIPREKRVIECYGDYWHCNPNKCLPSYYNKSVHATAQEIWEKDALKVAKLKAAGYVVDVVWENSNKKLAHRERPIYL